MKKEVIKINSKFSSIIAIILAISTLIFAMLPLLYLEKVIEINNEFFLIAGSILFISDLIFFAILLYLKGKRVIKINKFYSITGIILSISTLIFFVILPPLKFSVILEPSLGIKGLKNMDWLATLTSVFVLLTNFYLFIFSILSLFRPMEIPSILGMILSSTACILATMVIILGYHPNPTLLEATRGLLFIFSTMFSIGVSAKGKFERF
jgi:hypothetical protein